MNKNYWVVVVGLTLAGGLALGFFFGQKDSEADSNDGAGPNGPAVAVGSGVASGVTASGSSNPAWETETEVALGASGSNAALANRAPPSGKYMMLEANLLTSGYINRGAMDLLGSKSFDAFYERFEAQNFGATDEMTASYRQEFDAEFKAIGKGSAFNRLSCATDVCIATIRTGKDDAGFSDWYRTVQSTSPLPIRAMASANVDLAGGEVEHRIMFTTSSHSGGFALGHNPG